jgi:putative glutamine amidotransferase
LDSVDGVLIPGGADIDPRYYAGEVTPELERYTRQNLELVKFSEEGRRRDPFEFQLVKTYSANDRYSELPMLGICRGMQMMAVAQKIPLYLDIKTELGIPNRYRKFDVISPSSQSLMSSIYREKDVRGFKYHHQGIRVPYYEAHKADFEAVSVTAFSHDGKIAEALEYKHRPALGVQFHPEKSLTKTSAPVFRWFLTKACEYKTKALP